MIEPKIEKLVADKASATKKIAVGALVVLTTTFISVRNVAEQRYENATQDSNAYFKSTGELKSLSPVDVGNVKSEAIALSDEFRIDPLPDDNRRTALARREERRKAWKSQSEEAPKTNELVTWDVSDWPLVKDLFKMMGWSPKVTLHLSVAAVFWSMGLWFLAIYLASQRALILSILAQSFAKAKSGDSQDEAIPETIETLPAWLCPLPRKEGGVIDSKRFIEAMGSHQPSRSTKLLTALVAIFMIGLQVLMAWYAIRAKGSVFTPFSSGATIEKWLILAICTASGLTLLYWFFPKRVPDRSGDAASEAMMSRRNVLGLTGGLLVNWVVVSFASLSPLQKSLAKLGGRWRNQKRRRHGIPAVNMDNVASGFYQLKASPTSDRTRVWHYIDSGRMLRGFKKRPELDALRDLEPIIQFSYAAAKPRPNLQVSSYSWEDAALSELEKSRSPDGFQRAMSLLITGIRHDSILKRGTGNAPSLRLFDLLAHLVFQDSTTFARYKEELLALAKATLERLPKDTRHHLSLSSRESNWLKTDGNWHKRLTSTQKLMWKLPRAGKSKEVRKVEIQLAA